MEGKMNASLPLTVSDYWHIATRRKWIIIGSILTALGIAGLLVLILPKSFRSSTLILVETQKIPEEYVRAIVGGNIEERLIMIQQQVMSRTLLSRVVNEFKLYEGDLQQSGLEDVIEGMRKNVKVDTVGGGSRGRIEAFSISFTHGDPMTAMKVTAKIASQFIEENLRAREQFVEGASEFLVQELAKAKAGLEVQEKTIGDFRRKYMGELPQQMEANLHALDRIQSELTATNESIQTIADRIGLYEKAIRDYETTGATMPGMGAGTDPQVQRLRELERTLSSLSGYKETYPDVIQTKKEIAEVKAQLLEKHRMSGQDLDEETMRSFDHYLHGLLRQRDDARVDLSALKDRRLRLNASMKLYEGRVERSPEREQDLMILIRDYDNMQRNYQSLLDKKLNAAVAENLEKRQKGEQFRIIDPANLPHKPVKPDPFRIMLIGLALGCGVGFGGAFALEQLKVAFRRPEDAEFLLGIPLLAAIPDFKTAYGGTSMALPAPSNGGGQAESVHAEVSGALVQSKRNRLRGWIGGKNGDGRNGAGSLPPEFNLVSKWRPTSLVAEQFRVAATRLALMSEEGKNQVIVVSSAVKGEGKSACAVNLGYTLARDLGKTTLVIDCDVKKPSLHAYLGAELEPGLAELLRGTHGPEDSIHPLEKWPLWLMPAGNQENGPVELSKVHQLAKILTDLRSRFEYIILDAPPILPLADMNVLASMADILALVIRAETTERDVVQKALNSLKPNIQAGILLTGVWTNGIPYYMVESRKPSTLHETGGVVRG
jgi:succinoglycan biosynthesis transport protein ExoP